MEGSEPAVSPVAPATSEAELVSQVERVREVLGRVNALHLLLQRSK